MCLLIETIQINEGKIQCLEFHQNRMNTSFYELFGFENTINLKQYIQIPNNALQGIWKCRIVYSRKIEEITFTAYNYRIINSLQLVYCNDINYSYKYENRDYLQELQKQKQHADEILIVKNGYITDTSYSNIAFYDGNKWVTPSTYLLKGTKREYLLQIGAIIEKQIQVSDLPKFTKARLLNCFCDLDKGNDIPIENIYM